MEQTLRAEMVASVHSVVVEVGDEVVVGDTLVILESMKMEIPVLSPKAGTIREIKVDEGEAIGEGQLVAILDA